MELTKQVNAPAPVVLYRDFDARNAPEPKRIVSHRRKIMYATSVPGLMLIEGCMYFTGISWLFPQWAYERFMDAAYIGCMDWIGELLDAPIPVMAVGLWIIGLSFFPLNSDPRGLTHLLVIAGNAVVVRLFQPDLSRAVLVLRFLYWLRQRPGLLTLNPINVVLSLLTSVAVCSGLAAAVGNFPPVVLAYFIAPNRRFPDQFCLEDGALGRLWSALRMALSNCMRRSGQPPEREVLVLLVPNVRPTDPGPPLLAGRSKRVRLRRSGAGRFG